LIKNIDSLEAMLIEEHEEINDIETTYSKGNWILKKTKKGNFGCFRVKSQPPLLQSYTDTPLN
jgi:hypothetical protein